MRNMRMLLLAMLPCAAACDADDDEGVPVDATAAAATAQATADLLAPVRATSVVIVDYADVATRQAEQADVREYARTVGMDHRGLIAALDSAARAESLTLTESPDARALANSVQMAHSGLEALPGADYDQAFVRAQLEAHRQLTEQLDEQMLPDMSASLERLVQDTRALVNAHRMRARQLLAALLDEPDPAPAAPSRDTAPVRPPPADTMTRQTSAGDSAGGDPAPGSGVSE